MRSWQNDVAFGRIRIYLKGQSNEILYLQFFHHSNLLEHLKILKYFRFWLRIRRIMQILALGILETGLLSCTVHIR